MQLASFDSERYRALISLLGTRWTGLYDLPPELELFLGRGRAFQKEAPDQAWAQALA